MPLKSSRSDRDIQFIHPAPKMRPTASKPAKNQGLASISPDKKIKIKNKKFRDKAAERCVWVSGGGRVCKRAENRPRHGYAARLQYVRICDVSHEAPRSPTGAAAAGRLRLLLRGLLRPYGGGCGAAATGTKRSGAGGLRPANGERQRVTGNGCKRPQIPANN